MMSSQPDAASSTSFPLPPTLTSSQYHHPPEVADCRVAHPRHRVVPGKCQWELLNSNKDRKTNFSRTARGITPPGTPLLAPEGGEDPGGRSPQHRRSDRHVPG